MKRYVAYVIMTFSLIGLFFSAGFSYAGEPALVTIEGSAFFPGVVTVNAGEEVVWKNKDDATHTVTADDGSFASGALGKDEEYRRKFPSAGTFSYSCDNHSWMSGKIEVR